jgi:hypothetical protein
LLLKIAGHKELMENYPDGKASIQIRERIVPAVVDNTAKRRNENAHYWTTFLSRRYGPVKHPNL